MSDFDQSVKLCAWLAKNRSHRTAVTQPVLFGPFAHIFKLGLRR